MCFSLLVEFADVLIPELYARNSSISVYTRQLIAVNLAVLPYRVLLMLFVGNDHTQDGAISLSTRIHYSPSGSSHSLVSLLHSIRLRFSAVLSR
jgi:hypothetical protein